MKYVYMVGSVIWASYYGEFHPNTIKLFDNPEKALRYKNMKNKQYGNDSFKSIRRKLN